MYTTEICLTTVSLLAFSVMLVCTKNRYNRGVALIYTSICAIVGSWTDLISRDEPVSQRAVYQLMHVCFIGVAVLHIRFEKQSITALGLVLIACSLLLHDQVSYYVRIFVAITGLVALILKDETETAYCLAVAAVSLTQDKSENELAYALIWLITYPVMVAIHHQYK